MAVMDAVSKVTPLASSQINTTGTFTIELIEADETPAVIIIRWPLKASVLHLDCSRPLPIPLPAPWLVPSYDWPRFDGNGNCEDHNPAKRHRDGCPACSCEQCNGSLRTDNQVLIHSKAGQGTSSLSSAAIKVVLFRLAFVV